MLLLNSLLFSKSAHEREYDEYKSTHETGQAMCAKDYLFKTLLCRENCNEFEIGCQRMVDDIGTTYQYKKLGTVTYDEIHCPWYWKCNKQYSCPTDRIVSGIKCNGWKCKSPGVYCDKLVSNYGEPVIGKECYWTDKITSSIPFRECPSGYVAKGLSCHGFWCHELKLQCCPLQQANNDCRTGSWEEWSQCTNSKQSRSRTVLGKPTGDGKACPLLNEEQSCQTCLLSDWSSWSECINGRRIRMRKIQRLPKGAVPECGPLQETITCHKPTPTPKPTPKPTHKPTPPPAVKKDCKVSQWSNWSTCVYKQQYRQRKILQYPANGGKSCPWLKESRKCCPGYRYRNLNLDSINC